MIVCYKYGMAQTVNPVDDDSLHRQLHALVRLHLLSGDQDKRRGMIEAFVLALIPALQREAELWDVVRDYPDPAPSWLTPEKWQSGTYHKLKTPGVARVGDRLNHLSDWAAAQYTRDPLWPKPHEARALRKKTLAEIEAQAEADFARWREEVKETFNYSNREQRLAGTEILEQLEDGTMIVRLLTPEAKDYEGSEMQHCVGEGNYDGKEILSLRDPFGKPHATLELRPAEDAAPGDIKAAEILQCKGKQNRPPQEKYLDLLFPYFKKQAFELDNNKAGETGAVFWKDKYYKTSALPEGYQHGGELDLSLLRHVTLPRRMEVSGKLIMRCSEEERDSYKLPLGISCRGLTLVIRNAALQLHAETGPAMIGRSPQIILPYEGYYWEDELIMYPETDPRTKDAYAKREEQREEQERLAAAKAASEIQENPAAQSALDSLSPAP
ncbi:MAG: PcfJ domain-containing protein [Alphaproteobacteria bacterium]|nr:PcfJ domain-containing protein [Alphaproteobacteria bacterium]